jgi:hypothetical protein
VQNKIASRPDSPDQASSKLFPLFTRLPLVLQTRKPFSPARRLPSAAPAISLPASLHNSAVRSLSVIEFCSFRLLWMQGACVQNVLESLIPALLKDENRKFVYVEQVHVTSTVTNCKFRTSYASKLAKLQSFHHSTGWYEAMYIYL